MNCFPHRFYDYVPSATIEIFLTIKQVILLKKLSGSNHRFCDGQELQKSMDPSWGTFASYWLERHDEYLKPLLEHDLITRAFRNSGPYGYGDDQQFYLSDMAMQKIIELKTDEAISRMIRKTINGRYRFDGFMFED